MEASDPREMHAREVLAAHPEGRLYATAAFFPVAGGTLNRSWRAETAQGTAFVRLANKDARRLGADCESELQLLHIASEAGLAPRPLLAIPGEGLLICEFVAARVLSEDEARAPARIEAIGRLLRSVHQLPSSPAIRQLDFAVQARTLETHIDAADSTRFRSESVAVFNRLAASRGLAVPCHNDVHAENVLDSGSRLVLVDWEYGGNGDPVYDLAGCVCNMSFDAGQRGRLLDAYGVPGVAPRLEDACWAYDYVRWLWYRSAAAQPGARNAGELAAAALVVEQRLR